MPSLKQECEAQLAALVQSREKFAQTEILAVEQLNQARLNTAYVTGQVVLLKEVLAKLEEPKDVKPPPDAKK